MENFGSTKETEDTTRAHKWLWLALIIVVLLLCASLFFPKQNAPSAAEKVKRERAGVPQVTEGLVGPAGEQGPIGSQGQKGSTGLTGAQGTPGPQGPAGPPGMDSAGVNSVTALDGLIDTGTASDPVLAVESADGTINVTGAGITVGQIDETDIMFGTGASEVSASDIPLFDAGGYYSSTDVELALQEIGAIGADITEVTTTAGSGLSGGVTAGAAAITLQACAAEEILRSAGATWGCDDAVRSIGDGDGITITGTTVDPIVSANAGDGLVIAVDELTVDAADTTIVVDASGVTVGVIGDTDISFAVGAGTVSAADIPIADVGLFYTGSDVEAALQEIGTTLANAPDQLFAYKTGTTNLSATYADVSFTTAPESQGITLTGGTDFTIAVTGTYLVNYRVSVTRDAGVVADEEVVCRLTNNAAEIAGSAAAGRASSLVATEEQGNVHSSSITDLTAGDVVRLQCAGTSTATNIEMIDPGGVTTTDSNAAFTILEIR